MKRLKKQVRKHTKKRRFFSPETAQNLLQPSFVRGMLLPPEPRASQARDQSPQPFFPALPPRVPVKTRGVNAVAVLTTRVEVARRILKPAF